VIRRWTVCVLALWTSACIMPASKQSPLAPGKPRDLEHLTSAERKAALRQARLWQPTDTASLDLFAGPSGEDTFTFDQHVTCEYSAPDGGQTGMTPKFDCTWKPQLGVDAWGKPDDVVKVKYGRKNGEVYSEVAATRLFWALGFGADAVYPVKVTCLECPIEPWYFHTERRVDEIHYDLATIERKLPGKKIEAWGEQGWSFAELDGVDAPLAHRDALKLLMVFVQNSDNKAPQQRLICLPGKIVTDAAGHQGCTETMAYVQDLGYSFGRATLFNRSRVDLSAWEKTPIWKDPARCVGNLKKSLIASLANPVISEEGRRFLASRLALLSDRQIHDMFRAARLDRRGDSLDEWVRVFKKKRAEIADHTCPAS
jgi:hypothetical protein